MTRTRRTGSGRWRRMRKHASEKLEEGGRGRRKNAKDKESWKKGTECKRRWMESQENEGID